ncbi:MAG: diacylglycerol kinase [Limnochordales bacterium]|nr:diacylglycerol kinase [Limnochordales bacterium]
MRSPNLIASFSYALQGLGYALRRERNLRIHFLLSGLVTLLGLVLNLSTTEWMILILLFVVVIMAELFNTAIETTVNLYTATYHPIARAAKNVAAAAVLVGAGGAVAIGYLMFFPRLTAIHLPLSSWAHRLPPHVTAVSLLVVSLLVLGMKATVKSAFTLQGGMPSWHAAVASSLATAILLLTPGGGPVPILAVALALLVAESRLEAGIHTLLEVVTGTIIGFLITLLIFQVVADSETVAAIPRLFVYVLL